MIKIVHVITGLSAHGAQTLLYELLLLIDRERFQCSVISLVDIGPIGEKIKALGIPVHALGMKQDFSLPLSLVKLMLLLHKIKPDVMQTWMYHANFFGGLCSMLFPNTRVVWGIHHSDYYVSGCKAGTIRLAQFCGRMSHWLPEKIIYCSEHARDIHVSRGYSAEKSVVITNGIVLNSYAGSRGSIRNELGLADDTPLLGYVARFHPLKDHKTFFKAAGLLNRVRPDVNFVLCGDEVICENAELMSYVQGANVASVTHLLGCRNDVLQITASLDIANCCSRYESFSLTVGEAMACGVPCVTTDIPGPVSIIGETGWIVPVGDAHALCRVWLEILSITKEERDVRGRAAMERIASHFSLEKMVSEYVELYGWLFKRGS